MKFIFKNLGPIHEAELELGDLTILAGRNNTGKTYVAYALYGFLKAYAGWPHISQMIEEMERESLFSSKLPPVPGFGEVPETVMKKGQAKWPINQDIFNQQRKEFTRAFTQIFSRIFLPSGFSVPYKDFEDASLEPLLDEVLPEAMPSQTFPLSTGDEFTIAYSEGEITIHRSKIGEESPPIQAVGLAIMALHISFLFPEFSRPFILPAERLGISLFYKELDFTKNRLVDVLQEIGKAWEKGHLLPVQIMERMSSRYALPIKDNIDYTRALSDLSKQKSELYDSKLFNDIRDMMGGSYKSSSDDIRFKSKARKGGFDIPLHLASSSARGLSDLYFFLRHVAKKGQLLIIDEPESHLDTANQIQFARLLARAVNAGLKVLITTHSDYIVKEINNLLMLGQDFKDKPKVLKKLKYSEHDFLKPESVRAYVAEKNSLTRCTIEKYGIDMPVFDTTIDKINRVSSELESRLTYEGEE